MAAASDQALPPALASFKRDPQLVGCRGRPDAGLLTLQRMHMQGWMAFIGIQQAQRFDELCLLPRGELAAHQRLQKLFGEVEAGEVHAWPISRRSSSSVTSLR